MAAGIGASGPDRPTPSHGTRAGVGALGREERSFLAMSEAARKAFACPSASGVVDDTDLAFLDRDNEDQRRILIEAEHPELKEVLDEGIDEVRRGTDVMSPALHIAMHEIVTNQLWANDPPEMWGTAERLTAAGYARHDVLHMLGSVVSGQVWEAMANVTVQGGCARSAR
jgi:hypothetical protein